MMFNNGWCLSYVCPPEVQLSDPRPLDSMERCNDDEVVVVKTTRHYASAKTLPMPSKAFSVTSLHQVGECGSWITSQRITSQNRNFHLSHSLFQWRSEMFLPSFNLNKWRNINNWLDYEIGVLTSKNHVGLKSIKCKNHLCDIKSL